MQPVSERAYYNDIAIPAQHIKGPVSPRRHNHIELNRRDIRLEIALPGRASMLSASEVGMTGLSGSQRASAWACRRQLSTCVVALRHTGRQAGRQAGRHAGWQHSVRGKIMRGLDGDTPDSQKERVIGLRFGDRWRPSRYVMALVPLPPLAPLAPLAPRHPSKGAVEILVHDHPPPSSLPPPPPSALRSPFRYIRVPFPEARPGAFSRRQCQLGLFIIPDLRIA